MGESRGRTDFDMQHNLIDPVADAGFQEVTRIRKLFPETWLWNNLTMSG